MQHIRAIPIFCHRALGNGASTSWIAAFIYYWEIHCALCCKPCPALSRDQLGNTLELYVKIIKNNVKYRDFKFFFLSSAKEHLQQDLRWFSNEESIWIGMGNCMFLWVSALFQYDYLSISLYVYNSILQIRLSQLVLTQKLFSVYCCKKTQKRGENGEKDDQGNGRGIKKGKWGRGAL